MNFKYIYYIHICYSKCVAGSKHLEETCSKKEGNSDSTNKYVRRFLKDKFD